MQWLDRAIRLGRGRKFSRPDRRVSRAVLEALEARRLFSIDVVTSLADSGSGSLRDTIAAATPGDTIQFNSGLSGGTITLTSGQIAVNKNLTIAGLGSASLTVSGGNSSTIFSIGAGANVSISGLTISNGNGGNSANGGDIFNSGTLTLTNDNVANGSAEIGAGLYNNGGSVTITGGAFTGSHAREQGGGIVNASNGTVNVTGTTFNNNSANEVSGGAISNEHAAMTLTNCTISNNSASTDGGGIANLDGSTLTLSNTAVTGNFASRWGGGILNFGDATLTISNGSSIGSNLAFSSYGGGMFNYEGTVNISNSTVSSNFCVFAGAGIMSFLGNLTATNTTFSGNGSSSVAIGGGVYTIDNLASFTQCVFSANQAEFGAGIFVDSVGTLILNESTMQGNIAQDDGGAIYMAGQAYISDSTIANNTADRDGGGILGAGLEFLMNDTIAANLAGTSGGGVFVSSGDTTAYNTIVATNTRTSGSTTVASDVTNTFDSGIAVGTTLSSNNLIGTGGSGGLINNQRGNKVGANPNLGPLQYNGGPTGLNTMALNAGSVAINAGNNSLAKDSNGIALATDERGAGFPRIVNTTVDIGAFEVQLVSPGSMPSGVIATGLISAVSPSAPPSLASGGNVPDFSGLQSAASAASAPFTPAQIRGAYGVNDVFFNDVTGDGSGETIAIVDAFNDPFIISDANTFSTDFGLPLFNSAGGPTLQVFNQTGGATLPTNATPGDWDIEESLDVEWAHAIAPEANIILFEANSTSNSDLFTAIATAAATPNVSVVSMSFGLTELDSLYSGTDETSLDSTFTTPAGHQGVTFLASTGDGAAVGVNYPSLSPNVIAVGGTALTVGTDGSYLGESAWVGGGGGFSFEESQPSYQVGNVNGLSSNVRTAPDVSMDADPQTGVFVIDSDDASNNGGSNLFSVGGTSLATPMWAGLIAIVNQGRALRGQGTLDGPSQTLPMIYGLPSADFHDITTGDNGFAATPGYDPATGRGTPIANLLVPALAGFNGTAVWTGVDSNNWFDPNNWNTFAVPNMTTDVIINFGNPTAGSGFSIGTLAINGGTLDLAAGSGTSAVTGLTITGTGMLDIQNNRLFINYGTAANPITTIGGYIAAGYGGGLWNGVGIISSTAATNSQYGVGYAASTDPNNPANLAANQIEIEFTLNGDANLDGIVNGIDFGIVSADFNQGIDRWDAGDFDYNTIVNGIDFGWVATNFNQGASLASARMAPAAVITNSAAMINSGDSSSVVNQVLDPVTVVTPKGKTKVPAKQSTAPKVPVHHPPPPPAPPKHHDKRK